MIELTNHSITINAPINRVFRFMSNMENYDIWFPGVVDIQAENRQLPIDIGKRYTETLRLPTGKKSLSIEVVQYIEDKLFVTQGNLLDILPEMQIHFNERGGNTTEVNLRYYSRNSELSRQEELLDMLKSDIATRASLGLAKLNEILGVNI